MNSHKKLNLLSAFQLIRENLPDLLKDGVFTGRDKAMARQVTQFCAKHSEAFWKKLIGNDNNEVAFLQSQKKFEELMPILARMHPEDLEEMVATAKHLEAYNKQKAEKITECDGNCQITEGMMMKSCKRCGWDDMYYDETRA